MSRSRRLADRLLASTLLRLASVLVPNQQRTEWRAEWRGEMWQVAHAHADARQQWQSTVFTCGAFQDALLLRTTADKPSSFQYLAHGSASKCLVSLFAIGILGLLFCLASPDARMALFPPRNETMHAFLISADSSYPGVQVPSIRVADYRDWTTDTQHMYSELAFYRPVTESITVGHHSLGYVRVAVATESMVDFLKLTPSLKKKIDRRGQTLPQLLLTPKLRGSLFRGEAHSAGYHIQIGGQTAMLAGVMTSRAWPLPSKVRAWLIETPEAFNRMPARSKGFVVARVNPAGTASSFGNWWYMTVPQAEGGISKFACIAVSSILQMPLLILLDTLLLALAALPATTPLPFGEYPHYSSHQSGFRDIPRWLFFAAKIALILSGVYFWSVAIAYCAKPLGSPAAIYIQMCVSFVGFLLAFRWAWRDQRLRCPVCLQLLSNPAQVGQASHSFLDWSGTEWICAKGHGFLHVPELQTSWLSIQRWLHLNPTWQPLFSDACSESPEMP